MPATAQGASIFPSFQFAGGVCTHLGEPHLLHRQWLPQWTSMWRIAAGCSRVRCHPPELRERCGTVRRRSAPQAVPLPNIFGSMN